MSDSSSRKKIEWQKNEREIEQCTECTTTGTYPSPRAMISKLCRQQLAEIPKLKCFVLFRSLNKISLSLSLSLSACVENTKGMCSQQSTLLLLFFFFQSIFEYGCRQTASRIYMSVVFLLDKVFAPTKPLYNDIDVALHTPQQDFCLYVRILWIDPSESNFSSPSKFQSPSDGNVV